MKNIIEIYKDAQDEQKNKKGSDMIKALKKQLMKNIEKDSVANESVQYDRDKFLYYKVTSNAYDISHVAIILAAVSAMLSVGSLLISTINNESNIIFAFFSLTIISVFLSLCLLIKYKLLDKIEIAKKVNIILDEIDREIWQGKDD